MNIAEIKQIGMIDSWIDFSGQIDEIKETKTRTKKNRLMTKVKIKDESGEIIGAWLYADKLQYVPNQIITANGMLKEYEDHKYIDYATVKDSQNTSQDSPKASQNTPQSTKPLDVGDNDVEIRKSVVCALIATRHKPEIKEVEKWMKYIQSGIDPDASQYKTNTEYVGGGPEGICPHCKKPLEDCTCDIKF